MITPEQKLKIQSKLKTSGYTPPQTIKTSDDSTGGSSWYDSVSSKLNESTTSESPNIQEQTGLKGVATGIAKGEVKTLTGMADIGDTIARYTVGPYANLISGKGFTVPEKGLPSPEAFTKGTELNKEITTPEGVAENVGFATEKIAEFLAPSSGISKVKNVATGLVKGTGALSSIAKTGIKSAIEGVATGGQALAQEGEINDNVKTASIVASLFPVAGSLLKGAGSTLGGAGKKIQQVVIKPSIADVKDGFKIENVNKYNLGGSLEQTLTKTNAKMNDLSQELKAKLADSVVPVNLNDIFSKTEKNLLENKSGLFGNISSVQRILGNLKDEISQVGGQNGLVDLVEANMIKRGAGTKGSWVFGSPDPDAKAVESVYNTFYNVIKTAIEESAEKSGNAGIKEINKQLSELIPINNAVLRRIPVESRNSSIGLTDMMSLVGSVFDPKALALTGVNRLSKSGQFGNILVKAGENLKDPEIKNVVLNRLLGN